MILDDGTVVIDKGTIYYVYVISNSKNSKLYVGMTKQPETRLRQHLLAGNERTFQFMRDKTVFAKAIHKLGENKFTMKIVAKYDNRKAALKAETQLMFKLQTHHPLGYNNSDRQSWYKSDKETACRRSSSIFKQLGIKPAKVYYQEELIDYETYERHNKHSTS